jgi:hypothetical protein
MEKTVCMMVYWQPIPAVTGYLQKEALQVVRPEAGQDLLVQV